MEEINHKKKEPFALYLFPGLDGTGVLFRPFLEQLSDSFEPHVVSFPTQEKRSYEELAEDFIQKLQPQKPFFLLGESFSGPLVVRIAQKSPQWVQGIVLVATFATFPYQNMAKSFPLSWLSPLFTFPPPKWLIRAFLTDNKTSPEMVRVLQKTVPSIAPNVWIHRIQEMIHVSLDGEVSPLPVLFLYGKKDRIVPFSREFENLFCNVKYEEMDSAHLVLQSLPSLSAEIIELFCYATQERK